VSEGRGGSSSSPEGRGGSYAENVNIQKTELATSESPSEIDGNSEGSIREGNHPLPPPREGNKKEGEHTPSFPQFPSLGGVPEGRGGSSSNDIPKKQRSRNTKNYMKLPYNPKLKERARELRKAGNLSEVLFWKQVRNKQFKGFDFDRQKIIGNYIVDFYCANCNVVIEIDGSSHDEKMEYDAKRDAYLKSLGLTVIHIPVVDVMKNMDAVMSMLIDHPALRAPLRGMGMENTTVKTCSPIDILDYIYAVLHSPSYREKYKEFLKIDFPRIPYPESAEEFWRLVELGGELRQIHLLESPKVNQFIPSYPIDGDNVITRSLTKRSPGFVLTDKTNRIGQVWINNKQYFDGVPESAWEFYIGGYQPAQKWLKDRKKRKLDFNDIIHYQKIIVALTQTERIMGEIDEQ
jgi:very-short-patch-repair endonuclease